MMCSLPPNRRDNNDRKKDRIDWCRSKVQELSSQGHSQRDSTNAANIKCIVNIDLFILRQQVKDNIKRYIDERLPEEYEKCLVG